MDDEKLIEKVGARPLLDLLRDLGWGVNISAWGAGGTGVGQGWELPGGWNLNKRVEDMHLLSISVFFSVYVAEDAKNSSANILQVSELRAVCVLRVRCLGVVCGLCVARVPTDIAECVCCMRAVCCLCSVCVLRLVELETLYDELRSSRKGWKLQSREDTAWKSR